MFLPFIALYSPKCVEEASLLKKSLSDRPIDQMVSKWSVNTAKTLQKRGAEPYIDTRGEHRRVFQQAGFFCEVELPLYSVLRSSRIRLDAIILVLGLLHLVVPEDARATILRYHLQGHILWLPVAPEDRANHPTQFRVVPVALHLDLLTHACLL